jgi:hypothetical protein
LMPKLHAEDAFCVQQHARLGRDNQVGTTSRFLKNRKCTR